MGFKEILKQVIDKYGYDIINKPNFLNILADLHAFDDCKSYRIALKNIIDYRYISQIISIDDEIKKTITIDRIVNNLALDRNVVSLIIEGILYGLGKDSPNVEAVNINTNDYNEQKTFTINGETLKMILVEGGTFCMGATHEQGKDALDIEHPAHNVTLSTYYIGQTEVTQALWLAVMGNNPSKFKGIHLPVENVSWNDCQSFILKLNNLMGENFRLPTEAEWEYAARGGNKSKGYKYSGSNNIDDVAWYRGNSGNKLHPVATKFPNELDLYDMSGNVWEWCRDWFGKNYYSQISSIDPIGPLGGFGRVLRGGSWYIFASDCRVSNRIGFTTDFRNSHIGLRLAL